MACFDLEAVFIGVPANKFLERRKEVVFRSTTYTLVIPNV
jgi:hypothetical protein